MSWAKFEKSWQIELHDLLSFTAGFCTCGNLKYLPFLTHLWLYYERSASHAPEAFIPPLGVRISSLSYLRE